MGTYGKITLLLPGGVEQEFALGKINTTVGRGLTNDIVLTDERVSWQHARLECGPAGCTVVSLDPNRGIQVNSVPQARARLSPGDVIALGNSLLRFSAGGARVEPEVTIIDSEADLDAILAHATLPISINETSQPRLLVHTPQGTREKLLNGERLPIGRQADNSVVLNSEDVSSQHAWIERRGSRYVLRDLGSASGTWVGKQRIEEHLLADIDDFTIGPAQFVFKNGFNAEDLSRGESPPANRPSKRRPVVIVPGFMGSELWLGSERIWPNVKYLFSHPDIYHLKDNTPIQARGLLREAIMVPNLVNLVAYSHLSDYLVQDLGYTRGLDLLEFAYDWRQDVRLCAQKLAQAIAAWEVKEPVAIIGHSLGTLVSRYYVECLGGKDRVGHLLLLGGPHKGIPRAATSLMLEPDLLPYGLMGERLRRLLATFPSRYQVLPTYACALDQNGQAVSLLEDECWLTPKQLPLLRQARQFRSELGTRSSVPTVSIFGYGLKTVTRICPQRDARGAWHNVTLESEAAGDATIPESSAIQEGTEIHPVQQYHGALYVDNDVKMRLKLELSR